MKINRVPTHNLIDLHKAEGLKFHADAWKKLYKAKDSKKMNNWVALALGSMDPSLRK